MLLHRYFDVLLLLRLMISLLISSGVALVLGIGAWQIAQFIVSPDPVKIIPHPKPKKRSDVFLSREAAFLGGVSFFLLTYGVVVTLAVGLLQGMPLFLEFAGDAYAVASTTLLFFLVIPVTSWLKNRNQLQKKYVRRRLGLLTFYAGFIGFSIGGGFALGLSQYPGILDSALLPRYLAIAALFVSFISSIYWPIPKPSRRRKRRRSKSVSVPYGEAYHGDCDS